MAVNVFRATALGLVALLGLSAQTPAPAGSPPPGQAMAIPLKSARHLEYSFDASFYHSGESHGSGMTLDGSGGTGSGVESTFGTTGVRGTVQADVVAFTTNGGLVVKIHDTTEEPQQIGQTYTCIVFGYGQMNCQNLARNADAPATVAGPSQWEMLVLDYIGRNFIDPSKLDDKNHWQIAYDLGTASVVADFTMTDTGDGKTVTVVEHKKLTPKTQNVAAGTEDDRLTYDRALSVPDAIHQEDHETAGGSTLVTTIDLKLTKDSFATS